MSEHLQLPRVLLLALLELIEFIHELLDIAFLLPN